MGNLSKRKYTIGQHARLGIQVKDTQVRVRKSPVEGLKLHMPGTLTHTGGRMYKLDYTGNMPLGYHAKR